MMNYEEIEIQLLNIQIGCILRLARLRKGESQHSLSISLDNSSTMVGRIERAEHENSWAKIFALSKRLDVNFKQLFELKSEDELLSIVVESQNFEVKLNAEKLRYYDSLKKRISQQFSLLNKASKI